MARQLSSSAFRSPRQRSPEGSLSAPGFGEQGSVGDGTSVIPMRDRSGGNRQQINPFASFMSGGGSSGGNFGGSVGGGQESGSSMGFSIPSFTSLSSGGATEIGSDGSMQVVNGDQSNQYGSLMSFLANYANSQAGLAGTQDTNRANVTQTGMTTGAQRDIAGINAGAQTGVANINADAGRDISAQDNATQELLQKLQNELGIYQTDAGERISEGEVAGRSDVATIGADSANYQAELALRGILEPENLRNDRYNMAFAAMQDRLGLGGDSGGGGDFSVSVPQFDTQAAQNERYAINAQREAAALNSPEYGGGSPMSGAAARDAALNRAMADTQAQYGIERQDQQSQFDNMIAALQQKANLQNAQTNARAPMYSFLNALV